MTYYSFKSALLAAAKGRDPYRGLDSVRLENGYVIGTDGHRMHVAPLPGAPPEPITISRADAQAVAAYLQREPAAPMRVESGQLQAGDLWPILPHTDRTYPDWAKVFNEAREREHTYILQVPHRGATVQLLRQTFSSLQAPGECQAIVIGAADVSRAAPTQAYVPKSLGRKEACKVERENAYRAAAWHGALPHGWAWDGAAPDGPAVQVNARYLADALTAVTASPRGGATIYLGEPTDPIWISGAAGDALVMPMRL